MVNKSQRELGFFSSDSRDGFQIVQALVPSFCGVFEVNGRANEMCGVDGV